MSMPPHIIDDRDPAVSYSGRWGQLGNGNEYNHTTTYALLAGLTANFTFQGTGVSVYGTIGPEREGYVFPISSYSLDGTTAVDYRANQTNYSQYNQLFYQSPELPNGQHSLVVTNTLNSDALFLDYFLVQAEYRTPSSKLGSSTPTPSTPSTPSTPKPESTSQPKSATTTTSQARNGAFTSQPESGTSTFKPESGISTSALPSSSSTDLPSIVGGSGSVRTTTVIVGCIVGVLIGVVILLIISYFLFGRQRRQERAKPSNADIVAVFPHDPTMVPFRVSNKAMEAGTNPSEFTSTQNGYRPPSNFSQYTIPQSPEEPLPPPNPCYPYDPYDLHFNSATPPDYDSNDQNRNQGHHQSAIRVLTTKLMVENP